MATGVLVAGANTFLDALAAAYPWVKLHTGDPGTAAASNAATETTRKQVTWAAASAGSVASSGQVQWTGIAGSQDATNVSGWTASTNGTAGWTGTITANAYTAGDTLTAAIGAIVITATLAS